MYYLLVVLNCTTSSPDASLPINFDYFSNLFSDFDKMQYDSKKNISQLHYLLLSPSSQFWFVMAAAQYFSDAITVPKPDDFVFKYSKAFQYAAVVYADQALQVRQLYSLVESIYKMQRYCYNAGVKIVRLQGCALQDTFSSLLYREDCMVLDTVAQPASLYYKSAYLTSSICYLHPNYKAAALAVPLENVAKRFLGACQIIEAWHELGSAHFIVPRLIGVTTLNSTAQRCVPYLKTKNANPFAPSHTCTLFNQNGSLAWTSGQSFMNGTAADIIAAMEALSQQDCGHLYYVSAQNDGEKPLHHLIAYILGIRVFDVELAEFAREEDILSQEQTFEQKLFKLF